MRKKILLVASLSIMALGLASCSSNLSTKEYEVVPPTKVDNLKKATAFIPTGVEVTENENEFLICEVNYIYSIVDKIGFAEYYPKVVQDEFISSKRNSRLDAVNSISSKYKSFTMTLEYVEEKEQIKNTILKKSIVDFETGNLYFYENDYTDCNGTRTETLSLETKAIFDADKFIIASDINVNRYCESDEWTKTNVYGVGEVVHKKLELYNGARKIYVEMPLDDVGFIQGEESVLEIVTYMQDIDFMLYYDSISSELLVNEDWSKLYYSADYDTSVNWYYDTSVKERSWYLEDYLLKRTNEKGADYRYTVNYQLNEKNAIESHINLNDYTYYNYDKEEFSAFYLVQAPYNLIPPYNLP